MLTVELPKAVQTDVRISSVLDEHRLDEHGAWRAVMRRVASSGAAVAPYVQLARTGRLWAVTPARTVRLVHALQRPLHAPDVITLRARRELGATWTLLGGEVRLHGASTDRIDVEATWTDLIDDPTAGGAGVPRAEERAAPALSQQVLLARDVASEPRSAEVQSARFVEADDLLVLGAAPAWPDAPPFMSVHELHSTRHRRVTYTATATSRFREYFPPERSGVPVVLTAPVGAGRRRRAELVATAAARPSLCRAAVRMGAARGWQDADHHSRHGGGLRLYLGRPWLASGEGELLGAVLWKASTPACPPPRHVERLVTTWGFDPVWPAAFPPPSPSPMSFHRRVAVGEDLPLLEAPDVRVTVAGHEVTFDESRDMWTCDLELDVVARTRRSCVSASSATSRRASPAPTCRRSPSPRSPRCRPDAWCR